MDTISCGTAVCHITYEQDFNWNRFAASEEKQYRILAAPAEGDSTGFYAFSTGMGRGYEIIPGKGCGMTYTLASERNAWNVTLGGPKESLQPGESTHFTYSLRLLENTPAQPLERTDLNEGTLNHLSFRRILPTDYRKAPVKMEGRVTLADVVRSLGQPKMRGVNVRDAFPGNLQGLQILKEWGCNQIIIGLGDPGKTAQVVERGHAFGMEMFLAGHGNLPVRRT